MCRYGGGSTVFSVENEIQLTFTPSCCTVRTQKTPILLSAPSSLAPRLGPVRREEEEGGEGEREREVGEVGKDATSGGEDKEQRGKQGNKTRGVKKGRKRKEGGQILILHIRDKNMKFYNVLAMEFWQANASYWPIQQRLPNFSHMHV